MIRDRLPFGESTARRLMAIANHSILSKAAHAQLLPPSQIRPMGGFCQVRYQLIPHLSGSETCVADRRNPSRSAS